MLNYITLVLGELATNCYLVWSDIDKKAVIIDPADDGVGIADEIGRLGLEPQAVLMTHGHFDHVLGGLDLKLIFQIPFYGSSLDWFLLQRQQETAKHFLGQEIKVPNFNKIDGDLNETEELKWGEIEMKIIKTPGHTPGGVCLWLEREKWVFSGDIWFRDGVGETRYSYGNSKELATSLQQLKKLPSGTEVMPGHGESFMIE